MFEFVSSMATSNKYFKSFYHRKIINHNIFFVRNDCFGGYSINTNKTAYCVIQLFPMLKMYIDTTSNHSTCA